MTTPTTPSIGSLVDDMHSLRELKRTHEEEIKKLNALISDKERHLIAAMEASGLEKTSSKTATASVVEQTRYAVEDWDAFYAYIKRNNYFHLLERRASTASCRELFTMQGGVPGVVPFTTKRVNLRNL